MNKPIIPRRHNVQTLQAQLPTVEQLKQELDDAKHRIAELQKRNNKVKEGDE